MTNRWVSWYRNREAVGSLLYLATISRPDISFGENFLLRFNNKPMVSHWKIVKRVFQYLKGTVDVGISFNGDKQLTAYSDSGFASICLQESPQVESYCCKVVF